MLDPTQGDMSVHMLDMIFGPGWASFSPGTDAVGPSSVLGNMFETFNVIVLGAMTILFSQVLVTAGIGTAQHGVVMGKGYNAFWTPVRGALSVGMLTPLPWAKGFCVLQVLLLSFISYGIGAADTLWGGAVDWLSKNEGIVAVSARTDLGSIAAGILKSLTAREVMIQQLHYQAVAPRWQIDPYLQEAWPTWELDFPIKSNEMSLPDTALGRISLQCPPTGHGAQFCAREREGISRMIERLNPVAQAIASDYKHGPNLPVPPNQLAQAVAAYENVVGPAAQTYVEASQSGLHGQLRRIAQDATEEGWVSAGGWYWELANINRRVDDIVSNKPTFHDVKVADLDSALPNSGVDTYLRVADRYTQDELDADVNLARGTAGSESSQIAYDISHMGVKVADLVSSKMADGDPLEAMQSMGNNMIDIGEALLVAKWSFDNFFGGRILAKVGKYVPFVKGVATLGGVLGLVLLFAGMTLAFYVPALPFILFTLGVVGWIILVLESIVAAPLWAAAHGMPEGEGFAGERGRQGYMLFLSVLMRPPLMVFGYFMALAALWPLGWLVSKTFPLFTAGLESNTITGGVATVVALSIVVVGLLVVASHKLVGLIMHVPDHVLKWVGQSAHSLGENERSSKVLGVLGADVSSGTTAMKGVGLNKTVAGEKKGDKKAGDGGGGDLDKQKGLTESEIGTTADKGDSVAIRQEGGAPAGTGGGGPPRAPGIGDSVPGDLS